MLSLPYRIKTQYVHIKKSRYFHQSYNIMSLQSTPILKSHIHICLRYSSYWRFSYGRELIICYFQQDISNGKGSSLKVSAMRILRFCFVGQEMLVSFVAFNFKRLLYIFISNFCSVIDRLYFLFNFYLKRNYKI